MVFSRKNSFLINHAIIALFYASIFLGHLISFQVEFVLIKYKINLFDKLAVTE